MADSDKIITVKPNTSVATVHPEIKFVGKDNSPMYLKVLDDNTLSFEGAEGQVFSISPTMASGDIFSVNDISGVQSIAVNADGTVALAPTSGNVGIGKQTSLTAKLHINTSGETDALRVDVDSSDDPDSTPFVIAEDGRVGIGTASPVDGIALTLNGDGTSYEGIAFQLGGSTKWKMSSDATSMYVDSQANGLDWRYRIRDSAGAMRTLLTLDGGVGGGTDNAPGVIIGNDGGTDSSAGDCMNKLQVNVGTTAGVQDFNDGILIVNNDASISQNDVIGGIGFDTRDGNVPSRVTEASAAIVAKAREDQGTGDKGAYLDFLYSPSDQDDDTASSVGMRFMDGKLSVNAGGLDPINTLVVYHPGNDWNNGILVLRNDTSVAANDLLGAIGFDARDGNNPSNVLEASAGIAAYASEDHSATDKGGYLTFFTSPTDQDDDTAADERMRLTEAGHLVVGATAISGSASHAFVEVVHGTQANFRVTDSSASASTDFAQSENDCYIVNRKSSGDIKIRVNGSNELITLDGGQQTAFVKGHLHEVVNDASSATLTQTQSGSLVVWTGGTLTLPTSPAIGSNYQILNLTGADASVAFGGSDAAQSTQGAGVVKNNFTLKWTYVDTNEWVWNK